MPEEVDELCGLQEKADRRMSEVAPRPLEMLWELKRKLARERWHKGEYGFQVDHVIPQSEAPARDLDYLASGTCPPDVI